MAEDEEEVQLNIRVPKSVRQRLKVEATERDLSLKDYCNIKFLKEYLGKTLSSFETALLTKKYGFVPKTAEILHKLHDYRREIAENGEDKLFDFSKFDEALADLESQVGLPSKKKVDKK